jgi:general secretion pathway protein B
MSILLNALRKSEAQRQLGSTPGIHTSVELPQADEDSEQQWIPLSMLAFSAIAIAWFGWQQYREPDHLAPASRALTSPVTEEIRENADATEPTIQQRTPVESLQAARDNSAEVSVLSAEESMAAEARRQQLNQSFNDYEAENDSGSEQESQLPRVAKAQASSAPVSSNSTRTGAPPAQAAAETQPGRTTQYEPGPLEPITFWQVPQSLRDGLPEIRITVLVYAEAPEDRWVLINGLRLVEKQELIDGVVLDEIRRDGAVFRYRNYRFLVKG